jgi:hypothetical protein
MQCFRRQRCYLCPLILFFRFRSERQIQFLSEHLCFLSLTALSLSAESLWLSLMLWEKAFANTVFLGVGFGSGFGVTFGFGAGVAVGFDLGVAVAVGFGVSDGNSISLFVVVATGFSPWISSSATGLDSVGGAAGFADEDSCFSDASAARSPAPPNQTMLSGFDDALAATLQRINAAISARCASAISTTFRQNRLSLRLVILPRMDTNLVHARKRLRLPHVGLVGRAVLCTPRSASDNGAHRVIRPTAH